MQQHPVPRNITGFQFKLIGDMTLKQFGYLAAGAVTGYILFKLLPLPGFINLVIGGSVFFLGLAFAFLPFQNRPIDQWLFAFIKSVNSPTQFIYRKENSPPDVLAQSVAQTVKAMPSDYKQDFVNSKKMLEGYLAKLPQKSDDYFDQFEKKRLSQTLSLFAQAPSGPTNRDNIRSQVFSSLFPEQKQTPSQKHALAQKRTVPPPVHFSPKKTEKKKVGEKEINKTEQLSQELESLRRQLKDNVNHKTINSNLVQRFLELEKQLTDLLTERQRLTTEVVQLRQAKPEAKGVIPKEAIEDNNEERQKRVQLISSKQATNMGILTPPSTANVLAGIIKDQDATSLSNVLITVKDLKGTPLRALKTNQLGQFFASTPLANGTYILEVEDPQKRYIFDLVQIKLTGEIVQPIVIMARKQVDPVREKLSKELFQKSFN